MRAVLTTGAFCALVSLGCNDILGLNERDPRSSIGGQGGVGAGGGGTGGEGGSAGGSGGDVGGSGGAQPGEWDLEFGGVDDCRGLRMSLGPDGDVIASGDFLGTCDIPNVGTFTAKGAPYDGMIVHVDARGEVGWAVHVADDVSSEADQRCFGALHLGADVYAHCEFDDAFAVGSIVEPGFGSFDIAVFKLDLDGAIAAHRAFGGATGERPRRMRRSPSGNVAITGWYGFDGITFDGLSLAPANTGVDGFVVELDPATLTASSAMSISAPGEQLPLALAFAPTGQPFVAGFFDVDVDPLTEHELFVATPGSWSVSNSDAGNEFARGVVYHPAGAVVTVGGFEGTLTVPGMASLTAAGTSDMFVLVQDPATGVATQLLQYGGDGADNLFEVVLMADDTMLIVGTSDDAIDFGGGPLLPEGSDDVVWARIDIAGNHISSKRYGTASSDVVRDAAVTDGMLTMVGVRGIPNRFFMARVAID